MFCFIIIIKYHLFDLEELLGLLRGLKNNVYSITWPAGNYSKNKSKLFKMYENYATTFRRRFQTSRNFFFFVTHFNHTGTICLKTTKR